MSDQNKVAANSKQELERQLESMPETMGMRKPSNARIQQMSLNAKIQQTSLNAKIREEKPMYHHPTAAIKDANIQQVSLECTESGGKYTNTVMCNGNAFCSSEGC